MTLIEATAKSNELNANYPNLKAKVITGWNGDLLIKVCSSDKAKTLTEMFKNYKFTF